MRMYATRKPHTFLFLLDDKTVIDANRRGNLRRAWINHGCEPNCEANEENGRTFIECDPRLSGAVRADCDDYKGDRPTNATRRR